MRDGYLFSKHGGGLLPLSAWPILGPRQATCFRGFLPFGWHAAPARGCGCGLYAYARPPDVDQELHHMVADPWGPHVWGVVELTGRVIVHELGYRAQYARPVAVVAGPHSRDVARRYGLIVLERPEDWRG